MRTKKLTQSQVAALCRLSEGRADFYDLARANSTGSAAAWLVKNGLASESAEGGGKEWQITDAGRAEFATGRIDLTISGKA